jgi:hypothetical protein
VTRAFAPAVRAEAKKALGPRDFAVLEETAIDQLALIEVARSIHARHSCGHRFRVWGLPYTGLPVRDQLALRDALEQARQSDCPEVTPDEAARMIGASERLADTGGLRAALESLTTWITRGVAAHELRHVADGRQPTQCTGCDPSFGSAAKSELAGYLASFATRGAAHVALLQACQNRQAARGRPDAHGRAMGVIEQRLLDHDCSAGPPPDLVARATRVGRELYGQRLPVRLPREYPSRMPLLDPL